MIVLRGVFILCSLECDSADGTQRGDGMDSASASEGCSSYVLWNVIVLMELMMGLRGVFILCSLECDSADGTHDGPQRGVHLMFFGM